MLSLSVNTPSPKNLFLSTTAVRHQQQNRHQSQSQSQSQSKCKSKPYVSIKALILPPSTPTYSTSSPKQQQLYQPFRPPPSPIPSKYRNLDTNGRLEILSDRLGQWFEYAPLITSLINEGFTSSTLEEITGIASVEQNCLVVAAQVRDSLVESTDEETVAYFDPLGSPEILYEIRILNTPQRAAAARFIIKYGFDGKRAEELARSMKDFPRRFGERSWESFDGDSPGDCLAFMYFRQAQEHKSASIPELSKSALERALEVVESESARRWVLEDLEGKDRKGEAKDVDVDVDIVRVPVVRMAYGEVAESTVVVVFPVCGVGKEEVEDAPWECAMGGQFGVMEAEKGWARWVVLPGWAPVAGLKRGGVVVAFPKAGGVLPRKGKRRDENEEILVVADRGTKGVDLDDGFYLVSGEEGGLKVERGAKLKESGVAESLGTVILVVRPPRDEDDQLPDEAWD